MILSPTKKQRERILDNIIIPGSIAQGQDNTTPHPGGAPRFNDGTDAMYRLSPYAFLIERKSYCALYHSLNLKKIFGDDRLAKFFRMGSACQPHRLQDFEELLKAGDNESRAGDIRILVDDGFLIREECDSSSLLSKLKATHNFKSPHINLLYLLLTNNCNLKCTYCSIESAERKPSHFTHSFMSKEMARRGIDLFLKTLHENATMVTIVYYGGEPLLNWEVQLDSLVHIRELENKDRFNGRKVDIYTPHGIN
jgi:sulfatase maturation enzyme AslB (radical SAM superfamily)